MLGGEVRNHLTGKSQLQVNLPKPEKRGSTKFVIRSNSLIISLAAHFINSSTTAIDSKFTRETIKLFFGSMNEVE